MVRLSLLALLCLLSLASLAAATVHNVSTTGQLTTAINAAVAGDEIILANGTYSGATFNTANAGTSGSKITLRALNRHQAIIQGANGCNGTAGLTIDQPWWVVQDLKFTNHGRAITITGDNVEIAHNIFDNFHEDGLRVEGDLALIHHNVISHGTACSGADSGGIYVWLAGNATLRDNIIFATGDNGYQFGNKQGYGISIADGNLGGWTGLTFGNLAQGNLLFANGGKAPLRVLNATDNIVRDNLILWGEGGNASDDCEDDDNSFLNNLVVGNYHSSWSTKGNLGGARGQLDVQHNTFVTDAFSRTGFASNNGGCGGIKIGNTFKNNVFYSPDPQGAGSNAHYLIELASQGTNCADCNYNLFWGNSGTATWTPAYSYGAQDIHATGSPPVFVSASQGNYALHTTSPGFNAGSDGASMGIAWNASLRQQWAANAFALPTQQQTGLTGLTSLPAPFTVNPTRYYQVWFYIPNSPGACGAQQFTVESTTLNLVRDITGLTTGGSWVQPGGPARYITLGRHKATDGTLNVFWQTANCVERVFIRELPTADEAYLWMPAATSGPPTITISSPNSGNDVTVSSSPVTVSGSATDDVGVTVTVACSPACGNPSVSGTPSWSASVPLQAGPNIITATATDADNPSVQDMITITLTVPPVVTTSPVAPAFSGHWVR